VIDYRVAGGVATITLDSPSNRNALSFRLVEQLKEAVAAATADPAARVIVLTGTGPVFCSGLDLKEQAAGGAVPDVAGVIHALWNGPKPTVARLNGPARAGGLGLVTACDIAIASAEATFAFTEVRIGVAPAMIAVTCLRRMDPRAAAEYFLTGETFDGVRAQEIGLVNRTVPLGELDATVDHYVDMLLRGAPEALTLAKRIPRLVPDLTVEDGLERMAALSAEKFASAEAAEGIAAFREKRNPSWYPGSA
jgi:methylglutaconyl-CoA hydratase